MSYEVNVIGNKRKAYIEVNSDPSEALCEDMVLILMGTNKVPEEI